LTEFFNFPLLKEFTVPAWMSRATKTKVVVLNYAAHIKHSVLCVRIYTVDCCLSALAGWYRCGYNSEQCNWFWKCETCCLLIFAIDVDQYILDVSFIVFAHVAVRAEDCDVTGVCLILW